MTGDLEFERAFRATLAAGASPTLPDALRALELVLDHARHPGSTLDACAVCVVDSEDAFLAELATEAGR